MFGIGGFELFVILVFGFLIFGPDKLPAMAKTLGKAISKFKNAQSEMTTVIKQEVYDPNSDEPFKNPVDAIEKATEAGKRAAGIKTYSNSSSSNSNAQKTEASSSDGKPHTTAKQESFLERKARYEREQAKKAAAQKKNTPNSTENASDTKKVRVKVNKTSASSASETSESQGE